MKKSICVFAFLCIASLLFMGCNTGFKKRNSGQVNISMEIPRTWKHVNKEVLKTYIPDNEINQFGTMFDNAKYKVDGYVSNETAYIIIRQAKLKDVFIDEAKINSLTDFINLFGLQPDNYYGKVFDMNGTSCLMLRTNLGFGRGAGVAIKNGTIYVLDIYMENTGLYNPQLIQNILFDSLKFGVNGIWAGFFDGLFFPIKLIVHFFNNNVRFFAVANNGASYIIGFVLGLMILLAFVGKITGN